MYIITPLHKIKRNQDKYLANKLGDELVMMDIEKGTFVAMNNVGADIWNMCDDLLTVNDIVKRLMGIYEISQEECLKQTVSFLEHSQTQDIFIIQSPSK